MNNTVKIILGITAGIVILCLCGAVSGLLLFRSTGWVLSETFNTDANEVENVSGSIADYTVPAGFGEAYTTQVAGFSMVSYTGDDNHRHIYFFQLPAGIQVDQAEIERQLQDAAPEDSQRWVDRMEVVDRQPATICGQDVTLVTSEGLNHDKQPFRQVSAMFQGRGGQALVVFSAPVVAWDQAVVDEFLASIQ